MKLFSQTLAGLGIALLTVGLAAGPAGSTQKPGPGDDPKPIAASAPARPTDPVPTGFAAWTEVYAYQARLNAAAEQIMAADPDGKASIVAAPQSRELRVYWPGVVPAAVRRVGARAGVPVSFRAATFSHRMLVAQAQRLVSDPRVAQAAPKADGSGVDVSVIAELRDDRTSLQAEATVPLTVTTGERPRPMFNRQNDVPQFYGGSAYESGKPLAIGCTNGFPIRFGNVTRMITANHCVVSGATVRISGQPDPAGRVTTATFCRDTALIDYPGGLDHRIYTGPADSSLAVDIVGATPDFVGNLINTGGAVTGEHFNIPVQAVDVFITMSESSCGPGLDGPFTQAGFSTSKCAVANGDSGGPVYSYLPGGTSVLGRGTISAGSGRAACPNGGDTGASTVFYAPLIRPANNTMVGSLDFYRAAMSSAMASDISGRWAADGRQTVIVMKNGRVRIDMSAFGRPTASGTVTTGTTIKVTFPDDATLTGELQGSTVIRWSDGSSWIKIGTPTAFDLQGLWSGGTGVGAFFSVNGTLLTVDMSAFHRPTAHGFVVDASTISVTFPDDRTNTGRLESPNQIRWSDGTFWTKL